MTDLITKLQEIADANKFRNIFSGEVEYNSKGKAILEAIEIIRRTK